MSLSQPSTLTTQSFWNQFSIKTGVKFILFLFILVTHFLILLPLIPFLKKTDLKIKRKYILPMIQFTSTMLMKVMNVKISYSGDFDIRPGTLIVCNHQSYFDLFPAIAKLRTSFICAEETANEPFIGLIIRLAGCLLINRHNKENIEIELNKLTAHLNNGINVVLYPESKCGDGTEIIRFRRPFFKPSVDLDEEILCMTINYSAFNGKKVDRDNRHRVLWYRQMPVLKHFLMLLKYDQIDIDCHFQKLDPKDGDWSKQNHIADYAHKLVSSKFRPL